MFKFIICYCIFLFPFFSGLEAHKSKCEENKKIYVHFDEITFSPGGMEVFFRTNGARFHLTSIKKDEKGYYFTQGEATWNCPDCGKLNTCFYYAGCAYCSFVPKPIYPD